MKEVYGELFAVNALAQVVASTPRLANSVYGSLFDYSGAMPQWVVDNTKNGQQGNMTADELRSAALKMINRTIGMSGSGGTGDDHGGSIQYEP